jgi:hypothetical protein
LDIATREEKLAEFTGLSTRWLRDLAARGFFPAPAKSLYNVADTLQGLFKFYRHAAAQKSGLAGSEKERKLRAERRLIELKLARLAGHSLDAAEVERVWQGIILAARQKLLSLPSKVSPRLPFCKSEAEMQVELEKEIDEVLSELARPAHYKLPDDETPPPDDAPNPEPMATAAEG